MMEIGTQLQVLGEVALALLLGAAIGYEREMAEKPAGLRTHMLVAAGAALLVGLGDIMVERFAANTAVDVINSDPVRIIEAIITGISFLGAGTILRHRDSDQVEGLTTAASILVAAAVGASVALTQFILAGGVTLLVLITLRLLPHRRT